MAVKIRLKRFGRKHEACYRICAMECKNPRDGRVIEELGWLHPKANKGEEKCSLKLDRIDHWLSIGAQPTDTVADLLKKHKAASK